MSKSITEILLEMSKPSAGNPTSSASSAGKDEPEKSKGKDLPGADYGDLSNKGSEQGKDEPENSKEKNLAKADYGKGKTAKVQEAVYEEDGLEESRGSDWEECSDSPNGKHKYSYGECEHCGKYAADHSYNTKAKKKGVAKKGLTKEAVYVEGFGDGEILEAHEDGTFDIMFEDSIEFNMALEAIEESADPTGLKIYHKDGKTGKQSHAIVFTAKDAARHEKELKSGGHKVTHRSLMYGKKEGDKVAVKESVEIEEAQGTSAKYAGKQGMMGGKYRALDKVLHSKSDTAKKWLDDRKDKRNAETRAQDPGGVKKGLGKNVVDTDKARSKAKKKGVSRDQMFKSINSRNTNSTGHDNPKRLPESVEVVEKTFVELVAEAMSKKAGSEFKKHNPNTDEADKLEPTNDGEKAFMDAHKDNMDKQDHPEADKPVVQTKKASLNTSGM